MKEHFHQTERLPKERLRELMLRSNQPALGRFLLMYAALVASGAGLVLSWNLHPALWYGFLFFFGMVNCSIFASMHEVIHNTAFESKSMNRFAARINGLVHIYPATAFRELHFMHHRHTHVPGLDPEISLGNRPVPSVVSSLPSYLGWLSGLPLLLFKILMTIIGFFGMPEIFRKNLYPFIRPQVRKELFFDSFLVLATQISIILLAIYVNEGFWGLIIGQVAAHCLLASYLAPEHNGLPHEGDILHRTRSIRCSSFVKFLMWNMPYHAEHHAYPAVPFHKLPLLHEEIKEELVHKDLNHPVFHKKVFMKKL